MDASLFVKFCEITDSSSDKLKEIICNAGKSIKELTLKDFLFFPSSGEFQPVTNGVYVFFRKKDDKDTTVYVGKTSSRAFIERIPAHFDARGKLWFNSLFQSYLRKQLEVADEDPENYKKNLGNLFENEEEGELFVTFITVPYDEVSSEFLFAYTDEAKVRRKQYSCYCSLIEKYLKFNLSPVYNGYKGQPRGITREDTLDEFLERNKKKYTEA